MTVDELMHILQGMPQYYEIRIKGSFIDENMPYEVKTSNIDVKLDSTGYVNIVTYDE